MNRRAPDADGPLLEPSLKKANWPTKRVTKTAKLSQSTSTHWSPRNWQFVQAFAILIIRACPANLSVC